jgi:hypothetical protein
MMVAPLSGRNWAAVSVVGRVPLGVLPHPIRLQQWTSESAFIVLDKWDFKRLQQHVP